ncbi:MAG: rhomboid family intramembrane serine protease [Rubinisphaera brasiliensis]|uniref:rhomboid family intramembrane serine protease n=1 Tax=Rubinisphaera brasiliensis TaxID=119 RepID=UPI00391D25B7
MFFLIPISTDAPIYHWPYGTVALIVLNALAYLLLPDAAAYALQYGQGLQPYQWVTSNFVHSGLIHLLGNMFFLWGFGLIIEGKLGTPRYLAVYLLIGVLQCAFEQTAMLIAGVEGASMGASAAIYGLMVMCLLWAPRNELTVFVFAFFLRVIATTFEVSILKFAGFFIATELLFAALSGFQVGSAMLHLSGVAVGAAMGLLLLKKNWVDCEGWDLFSVMQNKHIRLVSETGVTQTVESAASRRKRHRQVKPESGKKRKVKSPQPESEGELKESRRARRMAKIRRLLDENQPLAAVTEYEKGLQRWGEFALQAQDLERLAAGLYEQKAYEQAVEYHERYLDRFPDMSAEMRLRLATLYINFQSRPRAALRTLNPLEDMELSPSQREIRSNLEQKAEELIVDGVLELEGRGWS